MRDTLDPEIWGPMPSWWTIRKAFFWNWYGLNRKRLVGVLVCRRHGHLPKKTEYFDMPSGDEWHCTRCLHRWWPERGWFG